LLHHPFPEKGVAAGVRIGMTRQPGPRSYWQPSWCRSNGAALAS